MPRIKTYATRRNAESVATSPRQAVAERRILQRAPASAAPAPKLPAPTTQRRNFAAEPVAAVIVRLGEPPAQGTLHLVAAGALCEPGPGTAVAAFLRANGSAVKFLADGGSILLAPARAEAEFPALAPAAKSLLGGSAANATAPKLNRRGDPGAAHHDLAAVGLALQSSVGRPLPPRARKQLESAYDANLTGVRVHTDAAADRAARSIDALAFTTGQNVYFRTGRFEPEAGAGNHLLAHEVAHTVQQGASHGNSSTVLPDASWQISRPGDRLELEADRAAAGATRAEPATLGSLSSGVSRSISRREAGRGDQAPPGPTSNPAPTPGPQPSPARAVPAKSADSQSPAAKQKNEPAGPDGGARAPLALKPTEAGSESAPTAGALPAPDSASAPAAPSPTEATFESPIATAAGGPVAEATPTQEQAGPADASNGLHDVLAGVAAAGASQQQHRAPDKMADETKRAVDVTPDQAQGLGKGSQVQTMANQQKRPFNRDAFKTALRKKIESLQADQAKGIKEGDQAQGINTAVKAEVAQGQKAAAGDIEQAAQQAPPAGVPKAGEKLPPAETGAPPQVDGAKAVPPPAPATKLSMAGESQAIDAKLAASGVTPEQLQRANEPTFQAAADARAVAQDQAAALPGTARAREAQLRAAAQGGAAAVTQTGLAAMHGKRVGSLAAGADKQAEGKARLEAKRKEISAQLTAIFDETKASVNGRLKTLEADVASTFDDGASSAKTDFYLFIGSRLLVHYLGGQWAADLITGENSKEKIFNEGRSTYIAAMEVVIDRVATIVETAMNEVVATIAAGKARIDAALAMLDPADQDLGREVAAGIQSKFAELEADVEAQQQAIIDSLAQKYVAAQNEVDSTINALRDPVGAAIDFAKGALDDVIKIIDGLKTLLLSVLAKAQDAIDLIIADPIGFLGNLVAGVKQGVLGFVDHIGEHLKEGFFAWLFGALAAAGLQIPKEFDLQGILSLVLQVLGLTYANFRSRAVKIVGEKVVSTIERTSEVFVKLVTEGPAGLWEYIKEQASAVLSTLIDGIKSFLIEKVIIAGVTWLVGLLNPASAFVKACKAIYDIIMFFVERGQQILELVNAVLDSVSAIAKAAIGVAAKFVEGALAKAVPVAIGFLAGLLGLGGPSEHIKKLIEKIQAPVNAAIDWVIKKAVGLVKAVGKMFGVGGENTKDKEKQHAGVKGVAVARITSHLGTENTPQSLKTLLSSTLSELAPLGLKTLYLAADPKEEGAYEVRAQASADEELLSFAPVWTVVQLTARVSFGSAASVSSIAERIGEDRFHMTKRSLMNESQLLEENRRRRKRQKAVKDESRPLKEKPLAILDPQDLDLEQERVGGAVPGVKVARPAERQSHLDVLSYNTTQADATGVSHAESQFVAFLNTHQDTWDTIQRVDIVISESPCGAFCVGTLCDLAQRIKKASGIGKGQLTLSYHKNFHKTSASDLKRLGVEWTVRGPAEALAAKLALTSSP